MDFLGGALPNIMFIVGIIAIGIGLGIEFKVVEIKSEIGKGGRIAAFGVGIAMIAASIFLYIQSRPAATAPTPATVEQPASAPTDANPAVSASTPPPAPTSPEVTTAAAVTPPPEPVTNPLADLQALFATGIVEGHSDKDVKDLLKKWDQFQDALSKGDEKKANDHLRELQKALQEAAAEGKLDPTLAEKALTILQGIATQYGLDLPPASP